MKFTTVDEYILSFPESVQEILEEVRGMIKDLVPDAEEHISYNMPAFKVDGEFFVHFSAWKKHIGMYPIPDGNEAFQKSILKYKGAKSSLNFPLDEPMPLKLIAKVVKFRIAENLERSKVKVKRNI